MTYISPVTQALLASPNGRCYNLGASDKSTSCATDCTAEPSHSWPTEEASPASSASSSSSSSGSSLHPASMLMAFEYECYGDEEVAEFCAEYMADMMPCQSPARPDSSIPSLKKFICNALRRTCLPHAIVFSSLVLLRRFHALYPNAEGVPTSPHRLFLAAFMITAKLLQDNSFSNSSWVLVSERLFTLAEVGMMERELSAFLAWNVRVTLLELDQLMLHEVQPYMHTHFASADCDSIPPPPYTHPAAATPPTHSLAFSPPPTTTPALSLSPATSPQFAASSSSSSDDDYSHDNSLPPTPPSASVSPAGKRRKTTPYVAGRGAVDTPPGSTENLPMSLRDGRRHGRGRGRGKGGVKPAFYLGSDEITARTYLLPQELRGC